MNAELIKYLEEYQVSPLEDYFDIFFDLISLFKTPNEELQKFITSIENGGIFIKVDTCDCIFGATKIRTQKN